jgi:hypothetical protein
VASLPVLASVLPLDPELLPELVLEPPLELVLLVLEVLPPELVLDDVLPPPELVLLVELLPRPLLVLPPPLLDVLLPDPEPELLPKPPSGFEAVTVHAATAPTTPTTIETRTRFMFQSLPARLRTFPLAQPTLASSTF